MNLMREHSILVFLFDLVSRVATLLRANLTGDSISFHLAGI